MPNQPPTPPHQPRLLPLEGTGWAGDGIGPAPGRFTLSGSGGERSIFRPAEIDRALELGAKLVISVSGGKDSQAMAYALAREFPKADKRLLWADLGDAEWPQTPRMVESFSRDLNIPLERVQKQKDGAGEDFIDFYEAKMRRYASEKPGVVFWMSAQTRDCTSGFKRGPTNTFFAHLTLVINAEGIRAEESPNRAKQPPLTIRANSANLFKGMTPLEAIEAWAEAEATHRNAPTTHAPQTITPRGAGAHKPLLALNWHPIHHWTEEHVWNEIGHTKADLEHRRHQYRNGQHQQALEGWTAHPCYVFGAARCSCILCVLGDRNSLRVGAEHNPAVAERYVAMERESGYTFRQDLALGELVRE